MKKIVYFLTILYSAVNTSHAMKKEMSYESSSAILDQVKQKQTADGYETTFTFGEIEFKSVYSESDGFEYYMDDNKYDCDTFYLCLEGMLEHENVSEQHKGYIIPKFTTPYTNLLTRKKTKKSKK